MPIEGILGVRDQHVDTLGPGELGEEMQDAPHYQRVGIVDPVGERSGQRIGGGQPGQIDVEPSQPRAGVGAPPGAGAPPGGVPAPSIWTGSAAIWAGCPRCIAVGVGS